MCISRLAVSESCLKTCRSTASVQVAVASRPWARGPDEAKCRTVMRQGTNLNISEVVQAELCAHGSWMLLDESSNPQRCHLITFLPCIPPRPSDRDGALSGQSIFGIVSGWFDFVFIKSLLRSGAPRLLNVHHFGRGTLSECSV